MRKRWARAVCLAVCLHGVGSCGIAAAQELDGCEEITRGSITAVADRLSLERDQLAWLLARHGAGRLSDPGDLKDMPGMGSALKDALTASFCWAPPWEGRVEASVRSREDGPRREGRTRFRRSGLDLSGRFRWDTGADMILRGAMTYHGYGWSGRAGTLHARRGLGLLLATPGAEPRGSSPVRSAVGGWRSSASLEPEVVSGLSLRRDAGTWYGEGSWLRGNVEDAEGDRRRRWWGTLEYGRRGRREVGLVQVFSEAGWSVGLHTGASAGSGNWSAEWAWSGRGTAQGAVWNLAEGAWRFRAGLTRVGAGYRVPSVRLYRTGSTQETVVFRLETRWQAGVGRFLRFGLEDERGVSGEAWVRTDNTIEVEAGERIRPGAQLVVLWRSRRRGDLGSLVTPGDVERTIRGELDIHRRTWRARIRLEERNSGTGRARATSVRFGRTALAAWEVRTALVVEEGRPPDIWWYGRRAGGLYGWDRLPTGTWVGAWARLPVGRWSIEVSADARGKRWDLVGAVRVPMG